MENAVKPKLLDLLFHGKKHPAQMGMEEVNRFLTHLAAQRDVSASTQNQALSAILFLYKEVLNQQWGWLEDDDLHPRAEQGWQRRAQSVDRLV